MREIILDTETTGLEPQQGHRIVEIGAVEMINKNLTGASFHYYVNPQRDMPNEAYLIHGISGEFLKTKPLFVELADEFLNFIQNSKLVIHNAQFDIKFLNHELSLVNKPSIDLMQTIDTLAMSKRMFPGMKVNLDALCKRFNVDNSDRKFHGALKDARLLAEVYVELTGGRQGSFDISKAKHRKSLVMTGTQRDIKLRALKVLPPSDAELTKHKELLNSFAAPAMFNS